MIYIEAMISNAPISSSVSHSVKRTSRSGHCPALARSTVSAADGIMTPVNGRAIRFVSRKCIGKVLKYIHANGAVATWHEMDIAAEFHIHLVGLVINAEGNPDSASFSGQSPFSQGYINAIPDIAA